MIKKTITINRNVHETLMAIEGKNSTVCNDSAMGNAAGTARLTAMNCRRLRNGSWKCVLQWDVRPDWRIHIHDHTNGEQLAFNVYESTSHKYWLRSLIRRCR